MREALEQVKRDLGPDAVIVGTRAIPARLHGAHPWVEVSAAPGTAILLPPREGAGGGFVHASSLSKPRLSRGAAKEVSPPQRGLAPPANSFRPAGPRPSAAMKPAVSEQLYPYYVHLVQSEVAEHLAAQLVQQAAAQVPQARRAEPEALRNALRECITRVLPATAGVDLGAKGPRRVAFVGPAGGGKTTTVAKLAAHFKLREGRTVGILSLDTHRPGAAEQLRRYADILGLKLHTAQTLAEVKQGVKDSGPVDVLLIDTPGVGLREQGRFARLALLLRAAQPHETHLVLPVSLTPEVQSRVAQSFAPLGIARAVLTRLDEVIGCGVILNIAQRLNLGVSYITTGQNVPRDIEVAGGQRVAELLVAGPS
jgi:flagellar biosynthesis protein FlhF